MHGKVATKPQKWVVR